MRRKKLHRAQGRNVAKSRGGGSFDDVVRGVAVKTRAPLVDVRELVQMLLEDLRREVWKQGRVLIPGFATFTVKTHKARRIAAPPTSEQETFRIKARRVVKIRATTNWRTR